MSAGAQSRAWGRRRWWFVVLLFFGVQLGLLFFLSERMLPAKPAATRTAVRLLTKPFSEKETFSSLLVSDPTVFVMASPRGFSGEAWLNMPAQDYSIPDWDEPLRLLEVNVNELGNVFTNFLRGTSDGNAQIADKIALPIITLEETTNRLATSHFIIEGNLANRPLRNRPDLPVWPHTDILRSSVVEVSVNGTGEVVLARLLSRSGLPSADLRAVAIAREISFKPVNQGADATNLVDGKIVFQWETVLAPPTPVSEYE